MVTQLLGGFGAPSAQAQANRLLGELAEIIGATPTFLPAPGLVGSPNIRKNLLSDPAIAEVARGWKTLTMALLGIGSLPPSPLLQASGNAVSAADQGPLLAAGAVGDVCLRFFDAAGRPVRNTLDSRIVGIDPDTLRAIPRRIGLAGGASKHQAIRAADQGRLGECDPHRPRHGSRPAGASGELALRHLEARRELRGRVAADPDVEGRRVDHPVPDGRRSSSAARPGPA